jgi:P-type Mg2+ transporter
MRTPDANSTAEALVNTGGTLGSSLAGPPALPGQQSALPKAKKQNIQVSPAVLEAARKDGEELLKSLRTTPQGIKQTEAEDRARTAGPNEVAQERTQSWPLRLLKIIRNPLVILLTALSAISFSSGDARAGTVMAAMVVLSVVLRFVQEARADSAAAKLKAMIHVTGRCAGTFRQRPLRQSREPYRGVVPGREVLRHRD